MRILRWITGLERIEKSKEIRARTGVANVNEKIREARLRWLGLVERKTKCSNESVEDGNDWTLKGRKIKTKVER